jgi:multidrug resistance efflux pump
MLTRISLFVALLAALAVGVVNVVFVKDKIDKIVTDRNTQRADKNTAIGERDTAKKNLGKAQKELEQSKQELAEANTEREKAVATAAQQVKKAEELSDKLAKTSATLDETQTKLAAYLTTGITADQVAQLSRALKKANEDADIAKEEQLVWQNKVKRLEARLGLYEGTNQVITLIAKLHGTIVKVDPRWDFVVLNIGGDDGAIENGEMLVSREGRLVAKVVIRTVEKKRCIANIVPGWKLGEVIEGDEVTPAHPAS